MSDAAPAFRLVITTRPLGRLHVEWQSPAHGTSSYDGTWSGKSFSAGNDRVVGLLQSDESLLVTEADSAQVARLLRER